MISHRLLLSISLFAAYIIGATAHANDSAMPEPVQMTQRPLTTDQARAVQKSWADYLRVNAVFKNSIDMQLCVIPPESFLWGARSNISIRDVRR